MLNFLGPLSVDILAQPNIPGCVLGITTRHPWLGALFGLLIGAIETLMFVQWSFAAVCCAGGATVDNCQRQAVAIPALIVPDRVFWGILCIGLDANVDIVDHWWRASPMCCGSGLFAARCFFPRIL